WASLGANVSDGEMKKAAMDALFLGAGMGVNQLERKVTEIWNWKDVERSGQEIFSFVKPEISNLARSAEKLSHWADNYFKGLGVAWDVDDAVKRSTAAVASPIRQASPQSASTTWNGAVVHISSSIATQEEIAAYKAAGQYKALDPSPVGGVYLG